MDLTPLVLVLVLGFVFLGWRTFRRSAEPVHPAPPEQHHHPYHCVVVEARDGACEAARKLADMRFLATDAPHLHLPQCSAAVCNCVYHHFEDRRHHLRRDPYVRRPHQSNAQPAQDRRLHSGRRRTDLHTHPVH